jgi:hypothetical protein
MNINKLIFFLSFVFLVFSCGSETSNGQSRTFGSDASSKFNPSGGTIISRINCPNDYERENYSSSSWEYFLQHLKLKPQDAEVLDYKGSPIYDQESHVAVIDYDTGNSDLQQCADAIIRLRAEYLFEQQRYSEIQFKFTSGHNYKWTDYANGIRPVISGNSVNFVKNSAPSNSYSSFRKYLNIIFSYAGTISLHRDLTKNPRSKTLEIGDLIITAGSPGHAVLVVDRAKDSNGNYLYLLAQSFMPAQSIHVLKGANSDYSPWVRIDKEGGISTDRYYFSNPSIRSF